MSITRSGSVRVNRREAYDETKYQEMLEVWNGEYHARDSKQSMHLVSMHEVHADSSQNTKECQGYSLRLHEICGIDE